MSDDAKNYQEQVAELRAHREYRKQAEEAKVLEENRRTYYEWRDEATESGNEEDWHNADEAIVETERALAALPINQPPQEPAFTPVERGLLQEYGAESLVKPHWSGIKNNAGRPMSNWEVLRDGSPIARGITGGDRNSQSYKAALEVLGPIEKTGLPTPDEVLQTINQTSKYGRDMKADDYNRGVVRLKQDKDSGNRQ